MQHHTNQSKGHIGRGGTRTNRSACIAARPERQGRPGACGSGFFSFDAAVASIALILIAHAILASCSNSFSHALSASGSQATEISVLQIADFLVKEGAAEHNASAAFPGSGFAAHHEISRDWESGIAAGEIAARMNLSYLRISVSSDSVSSGQRPPARLFCADRLALYNGEIASLEVCGA